MVDGGEDVEVVAACKVRKYPGRPLIVEPALLTTQAAIIRDAIPAPARATGTSPRSASGPTRDPVLPFPP